MITKRSFGTLPTGEETTLYTLKNASGEYVEICDYGGILVSLYVRDKDGALGDVLLGCKSAADYSPNNGYIGALIGRVGNRINKGECVLNGAALKLACNSSGNHLHGGDHGFNEKIWKAEPINGDSLRLSIVSPDGEEGYPGELKLDVTYTFTDKCELSIHYEAVSDKDTLVNLTNHAYFNLNGEGGAKVTNQWISINADAFTPCDAGLIPTGEIRPVDGTHFDFREARRIGDEIDNFADDQLRYGGGYDHNFCIPGKGFRKAAEVYSPDTGRVMTVYTDQPAVQFYAGNMLDGTMPGKCGRKYTPRDALCLETQNYPDAVNHPNFPNPVLKAGEKYDTRTVYAFTARK